MSSLVIVKEGKVEEALRRLKKKVEASGVMEDLFNKQYYTKPSAVKREKRKKNLFKKVI